MHHEWDRFPRGESRVRIEFGDGNPKPGPHLAGVGRFGSREDGDWNGGNREVQGLEDGGIAGGGTPQLVIPGRQSDHLGRVDLDGSESGIDGDASVGGPSPQHLRRGEGRGSRQHVLADGFEPAGNRRASLARSRTEDGERDGVVGGVHGVLHGEVRARLEVQVRGDPQVGLGGVPFAEEEVPRIGLSGDESDLRGQGVQSDGRGEFHVRAAQVDHELVVDEHPHVVVAAEGERLTGRVDELRVRFQAEAEIVEFSIFLGGIPDVRGLGDQVVVGILEGVDGEVGRVVVGIGIGALRGQGQGNVDAGRGVDPGDVVEPIREMEEALGSRRALHGGAVGSKGGLDETGPQSGSDDVRGGLEVGAGRAVEVADGGGEVGHQADARDPVEIGAGGRRGEDVGQEDGVARPGERDVRGGRPGAVGDSDLGGRVEGAHLVPAAVLLHEFGGEPGRAAVEARLGIDAELPVPWIVDHQGHRFSWRAGFDDLAGIRPEPDRVARSRQGIHRIAGEGWALLVPDAVK